MGPLCLRESAVAQRACARCQRDRDIIVRYEDAHGVRHDRNDLAEKARLRLREVGRSE